MATKSNPQSLYLALILALSTLFSLCTTALALGINYGTFGNNLPPHSQVANFLRTQTIINSIKIFDTNPDILRAFANSGISVTVSTLNQDITSLTNLDNAKRWVAINISPFYPQTRINRILVGNEILLSNNREWIYNLVPAMRTLHQALLLAGYRRIQITTPHYLGVMRVSEPPSAGQFHYEQDVFLPMLQFLRRTKSPFMFNPYPYFAYSPAKANYALFRRNSGVHDRFTGITYTNMYDAMLDAVHSAMKRLGFGDVDIVVGETGWPTVCESWQTECNRQNAAWFNSQVIRRSNQRIGTPLMPSRKFETYVFALFNENVKPGPTTERNWGLFWPDFTPVYNAGVLRSQQPAGRGGRSHPGGNRPSPRARPAGKKWCVPKPGVSAQALQASIEYVCSNGVDCRPIQSGGACFNPNEVRAHASFVMNSYYQTHGRQDGACDFSHTGSLTTVNPSQGTCQYF